MCISLNKSWLWSKQQLSCNKYSTSIIYHQCPKQTMLFGTLVHVSITHTVNIKAQASQVIELCVQTDICWGAVERLLSCLHSPRNSANSRDGEFVQVVTVEQLISCIWHKVMRAVISVNRRRSLSFDTLPLKTAALCWQNKEISTLLV